MTLFSIPSSSICIMSCERIKAIANSYLFSESERAQSWYACTNTPLPRILWSVLSRLAPLKHSLCLTPGKVCGKDLQTHTIPPPACWGAERSWKPSTVNSKEILQVLSWRCCRGREKGTGKKKKVLLVQLDISFQTWSLSSEGFLCSSNPIIWSKTQVPLF